jgi:hypothetical protein
MLFASWRTQQLPVGSAGDDETVIARVGYTFRQAMPTTAF